MKLVVGLGNPGEVYGHTRHNVGFVVVDKLSRELDTQTANFNLDKKFGAEVADLGKIKLVKPQTFMNRSGVAVRKLVDFYKMQLADIWVVHDDLDINFGEYKIDFAKGPKVHNGVNSVEEQLGSKEFWRVRVGTESRTAQEREWWPGEKYVLLPLKPEESRVLEEAVDSLTKELAVRIGT